MDEKNPLRRLVTGAPPRALKALSDFDTTDTRKGDLA
jgi:hypothetical protein